MTQTTTANRAGAPSPVDSGGFQIFQGCDVVDETHLQGLLCIVELRQEPDLPGLLLTCNLRHQTDKLHRHVKKASSAELHKISHSSQYLASKSDLRLYSPELNRPAKHLVLSASCGHTNTAAGWSQPSCHEDMPLPVRGRVVPTRRAI
jgi:hypothetical protein